MVFCSLPFLVFFLATITIYYLNWFKEYQLHVLIVASLVFYAYEAQYFLFLLVFSASINTVLSYGIAHSKAYLRKTLAICGIIANVSILAFFKYSPSFASLFAHLNGNIGQFLVTLPLPLGVSFYTFQGITLLVDTLRGKENNLTTSVSNSFVEHFKNTLFFVSFFPHSLAGPLLHSNDFLPQIKTKFWKDVDMEFCFKQLVLGYFFKMYVADNLREYTSYYLQFPFYLNLSAFTIFSLVFSFSVQFYADFSGYSYIATGLAGLFGYKLKKNFNLPFSAISFSDFWKRWHISMFKFLMLYVYKPLGGGKGSAFRTNLNLMITMVVGGIWHGASLVFVIWGVVNSLMLVIEKYVSKVFAKIMGRRLLLPLANLFVVLFTAFNTLLFRYDNLNQVFSLLSTMRLNIHFNHNYHVLFFLVMYCLPVFFQHLIHNYKPKLVYRYSYALYALMLFLAVTNYGSSEDFLYFKF